MPVLPPRNLRKHISLPGLLEKAVDTRAKEFHYPCFSPYGVELFCFDLRRRREHSFSLRVMAFDQAGQDAIDRALVHHYRPGAPRNGELIKLLLRGEFPMELGPVDLATLAAYREQITIPGRLRLIVEARFRELGYPTFSAYMTGLVRYDLLLGGPHYYFSGADTDPVLLAALDMKTKRAFRARRRQKLLLDYLIEEHADREMTHEERTAAMQDLARKLEENAIAAQKRRPAPRKE